jgi:hypothetical protein
MDTRTFSGITEAMWERMKADARAHHGTEIDGGDNSGRLTTRTPIGSVVLTYDYDPAQSEVTYGIVEKPFLVSAGQIWSGIDDAINGVKEA